MSYEPKIHGAVLLEYTDKPKTEWTYRLTQYGAIFRRRDGEEEWAKFYDVLLHAVPAHVNMVRKAPFQEIVSDNYDGPIPGPPKTRTDQEVFRTKTGKVLTDDDIQALADEAEAGYDVSEIKERPKRERRVRVAETKTKKEPAAKKEPAKKDAVQKPQRLGARAKKLLEMDLGLTRPQQEEVLAKADAISRGRVLKNGRQDGMTRIWDIYEAAGVEIPANIAAEREEFNKTGVMKRSGGGNGGGAAKAERGGKNAASTTPSKGTSNGRQNMRDPKPESGGPPADSAEPQQQPVQNHEQQTSGSSGEETETL